MQPINRTDGGQGRQLNPFDREEDYFTSYWRHVSNSGLI